MCDQPPDVAATPSLEVVAADHWAPTRDEYFAERRLLLDARQRSFQRFDQMVLGGATGALVLSSTFLEKLAPRGIKVSWLLFLAWGVLLISLSGSLFGQYASGKAFGHQIDCLDAAINGEKQTASPWTRINMGCPIWSGIALVIGIALMVTFAFVNAPFATK